MVCPPSSPAFAFTPSSPVRALGWSTAVVVLLLSLLLPAVAGAQTLTSCGGEDERPCTLFDPEFLHTGGAACDTGLRLAVLQGICVNSTRQVVSVDAWTDWALRNQLTLAIDEPLNWVSRLATHNAFNTFMDGYPLPNQRWSMTDQLRLGSRHFHLDLHWFNSHLRLCHGKVFNLPLGPAPDGVDIHLGCGPFDRLYTYGIKEIAKWLDEEPDEVLTIDFEDRSERQHAYVEDPLATYLGSKIFPPSLMPAGRMPTMREMRAGGRRVLILDPEDQHGGEWIHGPLHFAFPSGAVLAPDTDAPNLVFDPVNADCRTGVATHGGFNVFEWPGLFSWIAEDRVFRPFEALIDEALTGSAVRCGIAGVFLDLMGNNPNPFATTPSDLRHKHAVWSWRDGDVGSGDAAVLLQGAGDRWASRSPLEVHHFACARYRSETVRDPLAWPDRAGSHWQITAGTGTWFEGGQRCLAEFGDEYVFSVPVSGYQNVRAAHAADVAGTWLNYNDIKAEGAWVINRRPVANAGLDQALECSIPSGATTTLDGSSSADPEDDDLSFAWSGLAGSGSTAALQVTVPLGTSAFRLVVDDGYSGVDADDVLVTVTDTTAPNIDTVLASRTVGWAPNQQMFPVTLTVGVTDTCDPNVTCRIVSVTSNEPDALKGAGRPGGDDWQITSPLGVLLNAQRSGRGNDRVYTITVECTDASGNVSSKDVTVAVPHDQR